MKFENTEVFNFEAALRGMRNPLQSHDKSDSFYLCEQDIEGKEHWFTYKIGKNDLELAQKLILAGDEHAKFMRQIFVSVDITAPIFWWKEMDQYKINTVTDSESFMHTGIKNPFSMDQFENDIEPTNQEMFFEVPSDINEKDEIWKEVIDFPDYSISNTGKIYFNGKTIIDIYGKKREYKPHYINQSVNSSNYKKVVLRQNGKSINLYVHRLMAQHFIPNPQNLPCVNHKDGNKWNNNISNLEWCTVSENSKHAFDNNLRTISIFNKYKVKENTRSLDEADIIAINVLNKKGVPKKDIAKLFNVYDSVICDLTNGKTYKDDDFLIDCRYLDAFNILIDTLNNLRNDYLEEEDAVKKKKIWNQIVQLLPQSWLQTRTWTADYAVLRNIYFQRRNHKLAQWHKFCDWIAKLPYAKELITLEK